MAHIVNCMLDGTPDDSHAGLNNHIARAVTPQSSNDSLLEKESPSTAGPEKPFSWRMLQPERKYQLFPKGKVTDSAGKPLDPEQAFAHAMGQGSESSEKTSTGNGLRIRIKEHSLIRRRKISVPELGPMTTVHEVPMDSPTIPGRPPLHERSISAPGASWRAQTHQLADCITLSRGQMLDEVSEVEVDTSTGKDIERPAIEARQPLSPKSLTPLVIPNRASMAFQMSSQQSCSRLRSGSAPLESTLRSACSRTAGSPLNTTRTPYTPLSASTVYTTPRSALSNTTTCTLPTPISAPAESRSSPRPWDRPALPNPSHDSPHREGFSLLCSSAKARSNCAKARGPVHKRNQSDTGSIMDRGRPRKRSETAGAVVVKRTLSKRSRSAERRAFEHLPKGWKASDAVNMLDPSEAVALQKQAMEQASRFEVLRKDDVDKLSRELRHLDERTDYLRRTYTSLRAGRRNLHTRICQYLRSPRTAKFSHDSILKQEEALAELDASIDDWVTKLEQAENRRTRVRQKLLEHVAAATTLPVPDVSPPVVGVSESLRLAMGMRPPASTTGAGNLSTPPRSPTKPVFVAVHTQSSSPSPHRVVAHVPSTILEHSEHEEEAATVGVASSTKPDDDADAKRRAETIHIFADNDVYALLADVEDQITKMSGDISATKEAAISEGERRELHRARSQELLNSKLQQQLPAKASTPKPEPTAAEATVFLTSAVFKP